MAIAPRLEQRLGQALVMTPQLRQAIQLLQLSNLELGAYVEQELEKNPLLERDDATQSSSASDDPPDAERPVENGLETDLVNGVAEPPLTDTADLTGAETMPSAQDAPLDADYENVYDADVSQDGGGEGLRFDSAPIGRGGRSDFDELGEVDQIAAHDKSLQDVLREQLAIEVADPVDRMIGHDLIAQIDEAGYIDLDVDAVAYRLGCAAQQIVRMVEVIQSFEPTGVCARDLRECLALQLRDRNRFDPAMAALLDNLDLLAGHDMSGLMACCGVDDEDIRDMVAELRALNPKPGLIYASEAVQTVVPDVFVRMRPDGSWAVDLNSETLPRVLVDRRYHARISRNARSKQDRAYLADQLQSANWLVRSLDQRANTILKVATEIVVQQQAFLEHGVHHLKPLTLRDIADAISMHESTVSRVTSNKFMATPRGVFELKYFFTTAISSSRGGDAHSAEAVRARIKELIDGEKVDAVLSDDKIVELLRVDGIDIARRTVAKYREALSIPSSVKRRRLKSSKL